MKTTVMSTLYCRSQVTLNLFQGLIDEEMPKQVRHDIATRAC